MPELLVVERADALRMLDAYAIQRMDPEVLISFKKGVAEVAGSFDHCGLGNAWYGKYKKRKK